MLLPLLRKAAYSATLHSLPYQQTIAKASSLLAPSSSLGLSAIVSTKSMATISGEEVCCTSGKPSNNANSGGGQLIERDGMRHYVTGAGCSGRGIVLVHDIFGFDIGQTRQFADELAADAAATVVMPDLYHGKPWSLANFPPPDKAAFGAWLSGTAEAEAAKANVLKVTVPLIRERLDPGARLGVLGFCWGGKVALMLCDREEAGTAADGGVFACGASAHPAFLNEALVRAVKVPIALLPASDDPDMSKLFDCLKDRPFYSRCLHKRYDGVSHGFCAARGDRSDPGQMGKIRDACVTLGKFFADNA